MSSNDQAPLGCVFDDDNIQRDDDLAPDDFSDIDAVAFCLSYKGDLSDLGAKDRKHLYGCAIATLVACMGYGDGSPEAHQLAWDFLNGLEGVRRCPHSVCSQNYIDTGNAECIQGGDDE